MVRDWADKVIAANNYTGATVKFSEFCDKIQITPNVLMNLTAVKAYMYQDFIW